MGGAPLAAEYLDRFGGVGRLLGRTALERLAAAHACVIGVGGVGSWTVEALARSGLGALTLIDLDDVCVTNTNRQLPALEGNVGRPKVEALAERVALINPACRVTTVVEFFTATSMERQLTGGFSVVVDAIDAVAQKALLLDACRTRRIACVTVGGAGGKRDATQIRASDLGAAHGDELLRQVRKKLRRDHGWAGGEGQRYDVRAVWSQEKPVFPWADGTCRADPEPGASLRLDCSSGFGTAVWVTATFGLVAAQEAVRAVAGVA